MTMRTTHWIVLLVLAVVATAFAADRLAARRLAPPPSVFTPVGAIRDVMKGIVEPSSNVVFQSAGYTVNASGFTDLRPKNDDEWLRVRHGALTLAESVNLLKMTRAVARPEDTAPSTSNEVPELTPPEIEQRIARDRSLWNKYADALQAEALKALSAADAKDGEALLDIGDAIDKACENCHLQYWYPEEEGEAP
jgi:hypothetical protein